jgi:hypothetical protein
VASPDVLQALGLGPLRLAAALLRPPALSGLPPALADLASDPAARLDALLARVVAPPDHAPGEPEEAQRHVPATAPVSSGRFSQDDAALAPAPTQAFAQSPLLGLLSARRLEPASAAPTTRDNEPGRPNTELPAQAGRQQYAPQEVDAPTSPNAGGPPAEQAYPTRTAPVDAAPLWPSFARNGDEPQAPRTDAAQPISGPASTIGPAPEQPEELRLVRGLNQLHNLLNASVRREATAPTRPADGSPTGVAPLPTLVQDSAAPAHAAASPHSPSLAGDAAPPANSRVTEPDHIAAVAPSAAEPTQPLDVERLLDELAERLEIEYLRTYGTSG